MTRRIVLAISNRDYAARLAEFLRETESGWEVSAFTHEAAIRLRLQEAGGTDLLIGDPELLRQAAPLLPMSGVAHVAALVENPGQTRGEWPEIILYQPLPGVTAAIRSHLRHAAGTDQAGCRLLTVFSASGGMGKTSTALNLVRLAGERTWRTFYLNLETLNATTRLFGAGEPDSLTRLLYGLQTEPSAFAAHLERIVRHQPYLRTDYVDAPDHPGERASMSPELLEALVNGIRASGRYELIVVDPDSGATAWHRKLIALSDRVAWLATDDWQCLDKTERLLRFWGEDWAEWAGKVSFVRNRSQGQPANRWHLPSAPSAELPYVPQWKGMDEPGRLFGSAAFCGALDGLLDLWGWERGREEDKPDGSLGVGRG